MISTSLGVKPVTHWKGKLVEPDAILNTMAGGKITDPELNLASSLLPVNSVSELSWHDVQLPGQICALCLHH
jgi:hypothetical protein